MLISTSCFAVAIHDCLHASVTRWACQHTQFSFCSYLFSSESLRTTVIIPTYVYKLVNVHYSQSLKQTSVRGGQCR